MKNFIRNIREHKKVALVGFSLLAVLIVIAVFVMREDGRGDDSSSSGAAKEASKEKSYFADSDYPVKAVMEKGNLVVKLDGSKAPDAVWETSADDEETVVTFKDKKAEKDGKLNSVISPVSVGYSTIRYSRVGELAGIKYNAVTIEVDVFVSETDTASLYVSLSDIRQKTEPAGALDTDTPYLIQGDKVILPNGGDWTLTPVFSEKTPDGFIRVFSDETEEGYPCFEIMKDMDLLSEVAEEDIMEVLSHSRLVLKSESLGIEQKLDCIMSDERQWVLVLYDGPDYDIPDESESKAETTSEADVTTTAASQPAEQTSEASEETQDESSQAEAQEETEVQSQGSEEPQQ